MEQTEKWQEGMARSLLLFIIKSVTSLEKMAIREGSFTTALLAMGMEGERL